MSTYLFLRIAWMENYEGRTTDDRPVGAGSHVDFYRDGGEVFNFKPIRGQLYGFVRIGSGHGLRIQRLGAKRKDVSVDNITVVFFSRNPQTGGQYIVGWYRNATVFRKIQTIKRGRGNKPWYNIKTEAGKGRLIDLKDRNFEIPEEGPGRSNAWYAEDYSIRYIVELQKYMRAPKKYIHKQPVKIINKVPWQQNAALRKQIEEKAMEITEQYFTAKKYSVEYCHTKNYGWDMEASKTSQKLLLEVKGLSGSFQAVELTPNEFLNAKKNRRHYKICIVSKTLTKRPVLDIYYWQDNQWITVDHHKLKVTPRIGAILSKHT